MPTSSRSNWRDLPELGQFQHFHLYTLDVVDVVVSKLARYNANDVQDIDAMITLGLVPHHRLIERFRAAVDGYEMDARAERLPRYIARLHEIERDNFGLGPTEIDIPAGVASEWPQELWSFLLPLMLLRRLRLGNPPQTSSSIWSSTSAARCNIPVPQRIPRNPNESCYLATGSIGDALQGLARVL